MTFKLAQYPRVFLVMLCLFTAPLLSLQDSAEPLSTYSKEELLDETKIAEYELGGSVVIWKDDFEDWQDEFVEEDF